MRDQKAKNVQAFADKQMRQAAWNVQVKSQGLSVAQANRAASIIPRGASIKVLGWPNL